VTEREAAIFTTFADTVISPAPSLPPVDQTDAARALDNWLTQGPRLNAIALRAAITALDVAPLALGFRKRLRKLSERDRARCLDKIEKSPNAAVRQATKALKGVAFLCYYGDDGIMRTLGYDADANVARARQLRAAEGRP
jgi:hypothetical protein